MKASSSRRRQWLAVALPLSVFSVPTIIFGSVWGEELNHVWYSLGAGSGQGGPMPMAANNFGKVSVLGNPVYDFAIASGTRLPLQTGASGTWFVTLRHVFSAEAISFGSTFVYLTLSLVVFNHTLEKLGLASLWLRIALLTAHVYVPTYFLTEFDWYSASTGYLAMSTLVCTLTLLMCATQKSRVARSQTTEAYVTLGIITLLMTYPSSYVSYYHVSAVALAAALVAGRRHIVDGVRFIRRDLKVLAPILAVSLATVLLTAFDMLRTGSMQRDLVRKSYETTLFSPLRSFDSAKHLVLQVLVGDWRGLAGVLDEKTVLAYATANIPILSFVSIVLIASVTLGIVARQVGVKAHLDSIDFYLAIGVIAGSVSLWWSPIPQSIGVSDHNVYGHLVMVCSVLLIAKLSGRISQMLASAVSRQWAIRPPWRAFMVAFVVNIFLLVPTSLQVTFSNRELLVAPNSLLVSAVQMKTQRDSSELLNVITKSQRVMSLTEAFDAQKYFQSALPGFVSYNDLTAAGLASINSYPKMRSTAFINPANRYSSSLAPSSLQTQTGTYCPIDAVRFLAVRTLILSAQQAYECSSELRKEASRLSYQLATRDGIVISAMEFRDNPTYWVTYIDRNGEYCPILVKNCWSSLLWRVEQSTRLQLFVSDHTSSGQPVRVVISQVPRGDEWLILPLTYDKQLRVEARNENGSDSLSVESVNGFAAVRPPRSLTPIELAVTVSPDARMIAYGFLPYVWIGSFVGAGLLWRRSKRKTITREPMHH